MNNDINHYIFDIDQDEFASKIIEGSLESLIIVDFWAPWCGPCKQLTPILEKIAKESNGKFKLVKIDIDSNKELASQLNIQSIPAVFAFKDKKIVDGFQGVIPEKKIIEFIEKNLGEKLIEDFTDFYNKSKDLIEKKQYNEAKDFIEIHLSENSDDPEAISLFIDCLIGLKLIDEAYSFLDSLDNKILENEMVNSSLQKLKIIKDNASGPPLDSLRQDYQKNPNNNEKMLALCDKLFSEGLVNEAFEILFQDFNKNTEIKKKKILEFFEILGIKDEKTIFYRKKLSSILFS